MNIPSGMTRRDWLAGTAAAITLGRFALPVCKGLSDRTKPKSIAAIITTYRKGLHADVIAGKILEGWEQNGGPGPNMTLASMYVEQLDDPSKAKDMSRLMSNKHGVPIFETIEHAITVGGDHIPIDGVVSIGEHGQYPWNDKGQHLYPRRRFFEAITNTFQKYHRVVPVFSDKHLGPVWSDAKWMYDRAKAMKVPFMAGSSLPVSFRKPDISVPMGCDIEAAVGIGYSDLDIYGSHTMDSYQCLVERRRNAETGVQWVQCLQGEAMWNAVDNGVVAKDVMDAALAVVPKRKHSKIRNDRRAALFLFQYADGLLGTVFMLPESVRAISVGLKLKGQPQPIATQFEERRNPSYPHFAYLLKAIERMMHTGQPSYPVERVLLTSGILDRALTSRVQQQQRIATPELAIQYRPVDYPYAPMPKLDSNPLGRLEF